MRLQMHMQWTAMAWHRPGGFQCCMICCWRGSLCNAMHACVSSASACCCALPSRGVHGRLEKVWPHLLQAAVWGARLGTGPGAAGSAAEAGQRGPHAAARQVHLRHRRVLRWHAVGQYISRSCTSLQRSVSPESHADNLRAGVTMLTLVCGGACSAECDSPKAGRGAAALTRAVRGGVLCGMPRRSIHSRLCCHPPGGTACE